MSKILSLIIPVYNVEKYIEECINSVIIQLDNRIEIIIINDGTPDNSIKIIEDCLKDLPQNLQDCFIILNQENQGQSAARNRALDIVSGEYVGFVDSDDILDKNYIQELFNIIDSFNPDLISIRGGRFEKTINQQDVTSEMKLLDKVELYELTQKLKIEIFNRHHWFIWSYIVKKSVIKDNRFAVGIYFEDALFLSSLIFEVNNIYFSDKKLYNYRSNYNGSLLSVSPENIEKNINSYRFVISHYYNEIKNNSLYSISYVISLQSYLIYLKNKKGMFDMIKAYYEFIDCNKCVNKKLILNKGNFLFYKFGVFFLILISIFRK
ncbi:glycosyltransferase family 2 protein [Acinetobacter radioresistens]|uniref:glycosyltransferase family 2 protein n=1 Tax=Acinetobacter radioresistens TaxID=40216 RepID=UPI0021CDDE4D|nr:glycosyltransferase [Acinetobacter radioresistens]MCU4566597.1 glycosyltransferase [Acinetobacter radioresistens]